MEVETHKQVTFTITLDQSEMQTLISSLQLLEKEVVSKTPNPTAFPSERAARERRHILATLNDAYRRI